MCGDFIHRAPEPVSEVIHPVLIGTIRQVEEYQSVTIGSALHPQVSAMLVEHIGFDACQRLVVRFYKWKNKYSLDATIVELINNANPSENFSFS